MELSNYDAFPQEIPLVIQDDMFLYPFMISPLFLNDEYNIKAVEKAINEPVGGGILANPPPLSDLVLFQLDSKGLSLHASRIKIFTSLVCALRYLIISWTLTPNISTSSSDENSTFVGNK